MKFHIPIAKLRIALSYKAVFLIGFLFLPAALAQTVEPGLDRAVKWKWNVAPPTSSAWGLPPREVPVVQSKPGSQTGGTSAAQPVGGVYTVQKGDVLINIAKKHRLTVAQLKEFNSLETDFLKIGQELRLPTPEEKLLLKSTPKPTGPVSAASVPADLGKSEVLLLRVFLDNQGFGTGPISDAPDPIFGKVLNLYQTSRGETLDHAATVERAKLYTPDTLNTYVLRIEDFRFIAPPKALPAAFQPPTKSVAKPGSTPKPVPTPPPTYNEMIDSAFLAYRSPWEFVAERYHCDEDFLRKLNPTLPPQPPAGTLFRVPNVQPFEIEKIPAAGLQPVADPSQLLTASITDVTTLEIFRAGRLVAVMPVGRARPGLRGRGEWRILDVIAHPRLATVQENRVVQVEKTSPFYINPNPTPAIVHPVLAQEQYLPPGPNNPAGVVWINLAKGGETVPQPFGLHGTSIPSTMQSTEGIGGFRLTNWDILRVAKLLPAGTKLEWKP